MNIDVVTVSSKGQIVLPAEMRNSFSLSSGDKLAIYATENAILLKPLKLPTPDDFAKWMAEAQEWASSVGYKEEDIDEIIKSVRRRKRQ